ncbi:MAG: DNA-3-methyladenine glycosylase 2 family protein [Actinobacteria bacterium]|nr:DNA-3-methyladenine glycosylase 2 family protein [Actinomycetota bacterium]
MSFARTVLSHGVAMLPPMVVEPSGSSFSVTLGLSQTSARTVSVVPVESARAALTTAGRNPGRLQRMRLLALVTHILRLDEDLSTFYELCSEDPALSWAIQGAGRLMRSATVFEEVVKTICTTNCAWSATERMVGALVEHLGTAAPGPTAPGPAGRAFPSPQAMAEAGEGFYREVARTGYRGRYLLALARSVAAGEIDLEEIGAAPREDVPDEEILARLTALPGVGPYAAAHIMMMMGRYSQLVLDSWTRPTYARLAGKKTVKDASIVRRFRRYGPYAGLAFWLFLTRDWIAEPDAGSTSLLTR